MGRDRPELVLNGHQSDVKCLDWHPYRSLIVSGSRDSAVKLWDPKQGGCVRYDCVNCKLLHFEAVCSTISSHKKQINCCQWNQNGNWLATGSMDGLVKLFDIRVMKEFAVLRGQNTEVRFCLFDRISM